MPVKARPVRAYQLFWTARGPTCYSEHYGRFSKRETFVAAKTVRQAYYLAAKGVWAEGPGDLGILADYADGAEEWRLYTGERTCRLPWEHYQRLPRPKP